ncbi:MBL fold metallo-hydrolase [Pseudoalteromonas xiamenensis]|uniref:MBL fold metallo-hydrolase n=1 Tax=Pseudoalteromonas xiamenensis TaxID=882626 RepID=UPI00355B0EFD
MKRITWFVFAALGIGGGFMINNLNARVDESTLTSQHHENGKFINETPTAPNTLTKTLKIMWRYLRENRVDTEPNRVLPMKEVSRDLLNGLSNSEIHVIKLGHSSFILKVLGEYWLLDPVFSDRASPFSFIGPKRFQPTPISIANLPPIDRVLISHNHYDHLDKNAIIALKEKVKHFYVPLGVEGDLKRFGIEENNISSFDWWQSTLLGNSTVTFTPTQHFSGRGLSDGNTTLWGSWVIEANGQKLFFSGDSGYFNGFKEIGDRFGPFDLTLIETGAYDKDWHDIHMTPEESVQAHLDLRGQVMMPIHNGTFDLAFHAWYDPLNRVSAAAAQEHVALCTPIVGETVTLGKAYPTTPWWK